MRRGWRPILVGGAIAAGTFALAQAQVFAPSAPAGGTVTAGDVARGESVFERECAGCHGLGGGGGGVGPALVGSGLGVAEVTTVVQQGRGIMPAGIVEGQELADVAAYVASISD
jgi:cytochrome c551